MATRKKTTVQELKELIETTPKTHILTKEQLQQLRELAGEILDIRRTLEDLEGEDDISKIMFKVGSTYVVASKAEDIIDNFLEQHEDEDYDECGDNF
jgi:prefoldin subunit 5